MVLLFSFNVNLYAQQDGSSQKIARPIIVLKGGAKLYSSDNNFNQQVLTEKVVLKNSNVSFHDNGSEDQFLKAVSKRDPNEQKRNLKEQLKIAQTKKENEALQKVKEKHEKKKEAFRKFDFNGFPSPNQFFSSNTISKNYVTPSQNNHNFPKLYVLSDAYIIKQALDFLHSQKYTYYNNKSLDFCFSQVFSVRPPPVLV